MGDEEEFPLHEAVKATKILTIKSIITKNPKLILKKDSDERTPLHWAVSQSNAEIVSMLLNPASATSTSISSNAPQQTSTPHHSIEIDIDEMQDSSGWTPLHIAASIGNMDILSQLLLHDPKPDVNLTTNMGQTSLHFASAKAHYECCQKLIESGASARMKDKRGQTPLHRAASIGSERIVELLIRDAGCNVNVKDNDGWTALHHSLAEGNSNVGIFLVEHGADYDLEDSDGLKAVDVAVDTKVKNLFSSHITKKGIS